MRTPLALALASSFFLTSVALAGDPAPAAPAAKKAVMATPEEAADALAKFKEEYKAKGLKGDDRLSQKDFALANLAKVQHPKVVEAIADVSRDPDATLRMLGTIYLGDQKLLPGMAGQKVVIAWKRAWDDDALAISAMQSIARLRYLGAKEELRASLKNLSFVVKKTTISAIAVTEDVRLVPDMLALVGTQLPTGKGEAGGGVDSSKDGKTSGGAEQTSEGYSWEGAEATVDTGAPDDSDQKAAEAKVKEQLAKNQAAAGGGGSAGSSTGAAGGGGGGGASGGGFGGGGSQGKGGGGRSTSELLPYIVGALQRIFGRTFSGPGEFKRFWAENQELVAAKTKAIDDKEKAQKAEAAAQAKAAAQ